jgi:hypothetical protein
MATKKTNAKKVVAKQAKTVKNFSNQQKAALGIGLTAAAVAAAGAYFLYGSKNADKNRTKVKSWMLKAKAEVLETLEKAEEMSQEEYERLIENVSSAYSRLKDASKVDIATFKREMKDYWPGIEHAGKPAKKAPTKATKKATSTPKKVAKKAPKKAAVNGTRESK